MSNGFISSLSEVGFLPESEAAVAASGQEKDASRFKLDTNLRLIKPMPDGTQPKTFISASTGVKYHVDDFGLAVPEVGEGLVVKKEIQVLVPGGASREYKVEMPSEKQVLDYSGLVAHADKEKPKPKFNSSEVAAAQYDLKEFLVRYLLGAHPNANTEQTAVIANLITDSEDSVSSDIIFRKDPTHGEEAFQRQEHTRKIYNKNSGIAETLAYTSPGYFEQTALEVLDVITQREMDFIPGSPNDVQANALIMLSNTLKMYRLNNDGEEKVPELPDFAIKLLESVDRFSARRDLRMKLYDVVEQMEIPASVKEEILAKMHTNGDTQHPLAFELHTDIARNKPNSEWLQSQKLERQKVTESLKGTAQEMYDAYPALLEASRKVFVGFDSTQPVTGKIGIEIESHMKSLSRPLPEGFRCQKDLAEIDEIKRDDSKLQFGLEYMEDLAKLSIFGRDTFKDFGSMHLHIDRMGNNFPHLGRILGGRDSDTYLNPLGTFELRGIFVPETPGMRIDAKAISELVNLYTIYSKLPDHSIDEPGIEIGEDPVNIKKTLFGHICKFVQDPEARLSALLLLDRSTAFRAYNPLAFANSFSFGSCEKIGKYISESGESTRAEKELSSELQGYISTVKSYEDTGVFRFEDISTVCFRTFGFGRGRHDTMFGCALNNSTLISLQDDLLGYDVSKHVGTYYGKRMVDPGVIPPAYISRLAVDTVETIFNASLMDTFDTFQDFEAYINNFSTTFEKKGLSGQKLRDWNKFQYCELVSGRTPVDGEENLRILSVLSEYADGGLITSDPAFTEFLKDYLNNNYTINEGLINDLLSQTTTLSNSTPLENACFRVLCQHPEGNEKLIERFVFQERQAPGSPFLEGLRGLKKSSLAVEYTDRVLDLYQRAGEIAVQQGSHINVGDEIKRSCIDFLSGNLTPEVQGFLRDIVESSGEPDSVRREAVLGLSRNADENAEFLCEMYRRTVDTKDREARRGFREIGSYCLYALRECKEFDYVPFATEMLDTTLTTIENVILFERDIRSTAADVALLIELLYIAGGEENQKRILLLFERLERDKTVFAQIYSRSFPNLIRRRLATPAKKDGIDGEYVRKDFPSFR